MSHSAGPECKDPLSPVLPARTPGCLGRNDAGDPSVNACAGDTPGSLGVNDGAAQLCGPAMPKVGLDPPELSLVRARRQQLEATYLEGKPLGDAAAKHAKAFEDSKVRLGPNGDPALRRIAETAMSKAWSHAQERVKPAATAYAEAIVKAVRAGCFSLVGSHSAEGALRRLFDLEAVGIGLGEENDLIPIGDWAGVLDRLATYALQLCEVHKDPRGINLAIKILNLAEGVEAAQLSQASSGLELRSKAGRQQYEEMVIRQQQQWNPGIRKLQKFMNEWFSANEETYK